MISARIEAINNRKPKEIIDKKNNSFWFINGEEESLGLKNHLLIIRSLEANGGIQTKK